MRWCIILHARHLQYIIKWMSCHWWNACYVAWKLNTFCKWLRRTHMEFIFFFLNKVGTSGLISCILLLNCYLTFKIMKLTQDQVMIWHLSGTKSLPDICDDPLLDPVLFRWQWVKCSKLSDVYNFLLDIHHIISLFQTIPQTHLGRNKLAAIL